MFKVLMLGDTSSIIRNLSEYFVKDLKLTIGVDFYSKLVFFEDYDVKLNIWDFGDEARFRFLLSTYVRGANGALLLYDITNRNSLDYIINWIQIIKDHSGDIPIILVGTNLDFEVSRVVTFDEGLETVRRYNLGGFIEVSSNTGQNIEESFHLITRLILQTYSIPISQRPRINTSRNRFETTPDRRSQIFNRCIYCGRQLHTPRKEYIFRKIRVKELMFCCNCFKKFQGKTLENFPSSVVKKIFRNIKKFSN